MSVSGLDTDSLKRENFSVIDEFHVMGNVGTSRLAEAIHFKPKMKVLDLGCGIGGASRFIVDCYDCKVTGIDLTAEYIEAARCISEKVGIKNVDFKQADATELPFEDNVFDVVWTQHVQMNIEDKTRYVKEIARVLKPGGKVAYFDILGEKNQDLQFPLPWAEDENISFLSSNKQWNDLLNSNGFKMETKKNLSQEALWWLTEFFKTTQTKGIPALSPKLMMGENTPMKLQNFFTNLKEEKIEVAMGVYLKA